MRRQCINNLMDVVFHEYWSSNTKIVKTLNYHFCGEVIMIRFDTVHYIMIFHIAWQPLKPQMWSQETSYISFGARTQNNHMIQKVYLSWSVDMLVRICVSSKLKWCKVIYFKPYLTTILTAVKTTYHCGWFAGDNVTDIGKTGPDFTIPVHIIHVHNCAYRLVYQMVLINALPYVSVLVLC